MKKYDRLDDNPLASEFFFPGGGTGVLLIHGFSASPAQMRRLGAALSGRGHTVLGICLPGHGTHITDMERSDWVQWLQAAREGVHRLAKSCTQIFVAGLSMGGALSLILAGELPVAGVIPIAAPMRLFDPFFPYARVVKLFIRYREHRNYDPDNIAYHVTPVRKVEDLRKLMRMAEKGLPRIECPMLIVQGLLDRTVKPKSAQIIYDNAVNCPYRQILYLENSPHVCTYAPEFDKLSSNIIRFIEKAQRHHAAACV